MSALAQKETHDAYATNQRENETIRETEARALLSCASRMEAARNPEVSADDYLEAVRRNEQLWTIFQGCLCEKDNPLPRDLKQLLLNISLYVDKTTFEAKANRNPDLLKSLIDINRNIAAGLSVKPKEETAGKIPVTDTPISVTTTA